MKTSVSPVAVFLREEVCAVSDHLASVSLFDSDEWMACLEHFNGWTESSEAAKKHSRDLVSKLKLRPLTEPGDVDSPLLRSQIDEQYLRAMATARAQLAGAEIPQDEARPKDSMRRREIKSKSPSFETLSSNAGSAQVARSSLTPAYKGKQGSFLTPNMPLRHWHGYAHHPAWWQGGWHPGYPYTDDASVQSALSGDTSLSHGYVHGYHHGSVPHHSPYYPHMMYQYPHMLHGQYELGSIPDGSVYPSADMYNSQHMTPGSWMGHPQMGYSMHASKVSDTSDGVPATPSRNQTGEDDVNQFASEERFDSQNTPYKYSPAHVAMSPYWAHLQDHATLSMMGLATPQAASAPATPHHGPVDMANASEEGSEDKKNALNAQPLLLRQQYYGYGVS